MIQFSVLGSGSRGNSVYVETAETAILVDCGFSGKELVARLSSIGKDVSKIEAILVTHEHHDHVAGVGVMSRRYHLEIHSNAGTLEGAAKRIGQLHSHYSFETGNEYSFRDLSIKPFRVSHDTNDPVGFVLSSNGVSLGYCTDTGKITHLMTQRLQGCNGLVLECNHDPQMLKDGPYPLSLQQRVRSSQGHLANSEAAEFIKKIHHDNLQHIVLAHLSEKNNLPSLAREEINKVFHKESEIAFSLATQHKPLPLVTLRSSD